MIKDEITRLFYCNCLEKCGPRKSLIKFLFQECPECCVVCWQKISKEARAEIERERNVECSICLDDIECKSLVLECGHEYHNICANKMIQV